MLKIRAFPVNRDKSSFGAVKEAIRRLKAGDGLVVFPEGRRNRDDESLEVRGGVGLLASKAAVPVVPAAIRGAEKALPKGGRFIRPAHVAVHFGKPILFDKRDSYVKSAHLVIEEIKKLKA
ncbi:lysophospholipid acyltransferase family protein [Candidatus Omnitrophota bacterium]